MATALLIEEWARHRFSRSQAVFPLPISSSWSATAEAPDWSQPCAQKNARKSCGRLGFKSNSLCYSAGLGNAQTRKQVVFAFIADLQTTSFQGRETLPSQLPSQRKKWIVARATSKTAAPESNTFNDEPTCPYTQSFPQRRNVGEEAVFCMLVMCADHCRKESPSQANRLDSGPSCSQSMSPCLGSLAGVPALIARLAAKASLTTSQNVMGGSASQNGVRTDMVACRTTRPGPLRALRGFKRGPRDKSLMQC